MPGRREVDQASAGANQRGNAIDQYKMAEVVGAELRLKAVHVVPKWSRHYSRIGYDHVESLPARQEFAGAGADALQAGQIERDQLEAATIPRGVLSHLRGRAFGFLKVPRCSYNLRAAGRESPRRLNADTCGHAGDENASSVQIDPRQNIVGSGSCSPYVRHLFLLISALLLRPSASVRDRQSIRGRSDAIRAVAGSVRLTPACPSPRTSPAIQNEPALPPERC